MKNIAIYLLTVILFACDEEHVLIENNHNVEISDSDLEKLAILNDNNIQILSESLRPHLESYADFQEMIKNISDTELGLMANKINRDKNLVSSVFSNIKSRKEYIKIKNRYLDLYYSSKKSFINNKIMDCENNCFLESHETYFDAFFLFQGDNCDMDCADTFATLAMVSFYNGCVYGCED